MPDMPLAKWVFFHPARLAEVHAWVQANGHADGLSQGSASFKLSTDEIAALTAHLGKDSNGDPYVRVVYQFHGQRVYVPAGWVHQVENLQDCVKLAYEFFKSPSRLAVCLAAWQHVHARIASISATDYLYAAAVLCNAVDKLSQCDETVTLLWSTSA